MQVLVAAEVRADDDQVQQLGVVSVEVTDGVSVAADDLELPGRRRAGGQGVRARGEAQASQA